MFYSKTLLSILLIFLRIQQFFTSKNIGGSHQRSKQDILKILDYLYNFPLFGDSLYIIFDQIQRLFVIFISKGSASKCERVYFGSTVISRCKNFESVSFSETLCTLIESLTGVIFSYGWLLISRFENLIEIFLVTHVPIYHYERIGPRFSIFANLCRFAEFLQIFADMRRFEKTLTYSETQ